MARASPRTTPGTTPGGATSLLDVAMLPWGGAGLFFNNATVLLGEYRGHRRNEFSQHDASRIAGLEELPHLAGRKRSLFWLLMMGKAINKLLP